VAIFLYADYVVAAGVVLCAGCAVTANAGESDKRKVWVKGFVDACCKDKEGVAKGVICLKDREVISLIKVELRRFWKDIVIISLIFVSAFVSLLFV
jgi:hypothetical protein